ncbi:MAG: hypothetical protein R6U38_16885 [Desulfatiglandaceae bacterium]
MMKDQHRNILFFTALVGRMIFFDRHGQEVYRHTGFMSEAAIVKQLKKMGVG